jgi:hypothetical protein
MTLASIGPSWSAKAAIVRCHCDCAGPNATTIVSSRSNRDSRAAIACYDLTRLRHGRPELPVLTEVVSRARKGRSHWATSARHAGNAAPTGSPRRRRDASLPLAEAAPNKIGILLLRDVHRSARRPKD